MMHHSHAAQLRGLLMLALAHPPVEQLDARVGSGIELHLRAAGYVETHSLLERKSVRMKTKDERT